MGKFQIGLFTSAWDEMAWELVEEIHRNVQSGLIPNSEINFVFVSRDKGETHFGDLMINNLQTAGIPFITFSSLRFKPELREKDREAWRLEHDRQVMQLLPPTDLIVLVGYMWWFGEEMCQRKTAINLHPASPTGPKGTYREVIYQLIQQMAAETGVMMHLVTPELDRGPVITFCHFPIRGETFKPLWQEMERRLGKESLREIAEKEKENNPLFEAIRKHGVVREFPIVIVTIKALAERRIKIKNGKVVDSEDRVLEGGYDLSKEIESRLRLRVLLPKKP